MQEMTPGQGKIVTLKVHSTYYFVQVLSPSCSVTMTGLNTCF